jgi:hypothetical protein
MRRQARNYAMKIKCDPNAARKTMDARWERFEGLAYRLTEAIRQAIKDQSKDEQKWGGLHFTEAEARSAIACAVARVVGKPIDPDDAWWAAHPDLTEEDCFIQYDEAELERFIDELRMVIDPRQHFELYE